jgi:hypothetical protein
MTDKTIFYKPFSIFAVLFLTVVFTNLLFAQDKQSEPELSVAGIRLGDRASAKKFLEKYSPGTGDEGQPEYSFWNKFGNQVMKVSALSFDDPYFITKIEVFYAPQSYMGRHYVLKDQGFFVTENGIFIGYRQSAVSMIVGIPNVGREDRIGPKDVIRKKGEPTSRTNEDKKEIIIYDLGKINLDIDGKKETVNYSARYETNKNKLRRFVFEISSNEWNKP